MCMISAHKYLNYLKLLLKITHIIINGAGTYKAYILVKFDVITNSYDLYSLN